MTSIKLSSLRGYSEAWPRTALLYNALTDDGTLTPLAQKCKSIADQCSAVEVSVDVEDIEPICEQVHKAYCQWRIDNGKEEYWTKGDYSKLDETTKEADRYTVRAVLSAIKSSLPSILKLEKGQNYVTRPY